MYIGLASSSRSILQQRLFLNWPLSASTTDTSTACWARTTLRYQCGAKLCLTSGTNHRETYENHHHRHRLCRSRHWCLSRRDWP
ncbi:MAG: hypothetical protein VB124_04525 [Burkholderia sp.]